MTATLTTYLKSLRLGTPRARGGLTVIPVFGDDAAVPEYLTLREALGSKLLQVTEVDEHGSVPELLVENISALPVLMLDSEELCGAKQNRVLNTSVLVDAKSRAVVPVSCTEAGRWRYTSRQFTDSGTIAPSSVRRRKSRSVSSSLEAARASYRSDQGEVWAEIDSLHCQLRTSSPTGAIRDAYAARAGHLDEFVEAAPREKGQRGLIALLGGQVVGLDVVSRAGAYASIHEKLVRSYAIEALLGRVEPAPGDPLATAHAFLGEIARCRESRHDSVGRGVDCRYESDKLVGSALADGDHVVHVAIFRAPEGGRPSPRRRRRLS